MNNLLNNSEIYPSDEYLKIVMNDIYKVFESFINRLNTEIPSARISWRYYNDGKSWLCKCENKNKTVFWLSVWENCFKISLFFTAKTTGGLFELSLDEKYKKQILENAAIGKLIPLIFEITSENQLNDVLTAVKYKNSLK